MSSHSFRAYPRTLSNKISNLLISLVPKTIQSHRLFILKQLMAYACGELKAFVLVEEGEIFKLVRLIPVMANLLSTGKYLRYLM
jgi:hypothetical protein